MQVHFAFFLAVLEKLIASIITKVQTTSVQWQWIYQISVWPCNAEFEKWHTQCHGQVEFLKVKNDWGLKSGYF